MTQHEPQRHMACRTCGRLHPVVWEGRVVAYFDCVPGHIRIEDIIAALEKTGCDPQPVQTK